MSRSRVLRVLAFLIASVCVAAPVRAQSLVLPIKRAFATDAVPGCTPRTPANAVASVTAGAARDVGEARRAFASGQELALQGDPRGAGVAFARASGLDPTDDRIAYAYARALEETNDSTAAVREYCRALRLLPAGRDARDLRVRIERLLPRGAGDALLRARERFGAGVVALDASRPELARTAFDDASRLLPAAAEAPFNRAIAHLRLGDRAASRRDLIAYLALAPDAADRVLVQQSIDALGRPHFRTGAALALGLIPGMGQFYTRRPARGLVVLALAGGAAYMGLYRSTKSVEVAYVDPNGIPAPYTEIISERPYRVSALAVGAGITLAAALEAVWYAQNSHRAPTRLTLAPRSDGIGLALRF